jgi:hypothetical protein
VEEERFGVKYLVLDDLVPEMKPEHLRPPLDENMFVQYMEILRENMEREKRKNHV